jgi:hypothetical protein
MTHATNMAEVVKRNGWVIRAQTEGLTHEQSTQQPPFRGDCMNWVLGHIAENRDKVLLALEQEEVMGEEVATLYQWGWTLLDRVDFLFWYDTYHVCQLEYLRQLAGTDDAVIE